MKSTQTLVAQGLWSSVVSEDDVGWIEQCARSKSDYGPCGDLPLLIQRFLDCGIEPAEIARFARIMQFEALHQACYNLEDPAASDEFQGSGASRRNWALFELTDQGKPGLQITGLHEVLLSVDPTGREMRPTRPPRSVRDGQPAFRCQIEDAVWLVSANTEEYSSVCLTREIDCDLFIGFDGTSRQANWRSIKFRRCADSVMEASLPLGDFPHFLDGVPIISARSADRLHMAIGDSAELLPIEIGDSPFFALNVLTTLDALDRDSSTIDYFESSGRIKEVRSYTFHPHVVSGAALFRLAGVQGSPVFASNSLVRTIVEGGLVGLSARSVWPPEARKYKL